MIELDEEEYKKRLRLVSDQRDIIDIRLTEATELLQEVSKGTINEDLAYRIKEYLDRRKTINLPDVPTPPIVR